MTEAQTDIYVRGYNQGRADEAAHRMNGARMFKTPDITPAQIIALVSAILATAAAFGVDLNSDQQHVLIADTGVVAGLVLGDAVVRHGRATGDAKKGD